MCGGSVDVTRGASLSVLIVNDGRGQKIERRTRRILSEAAAATAIAPTTQTQTGMPIAPLKGGTIGASMNTTNEFDRRMPLANLASAETLYSRARG